MGESLYFDVVLTGKSSDKQNFVVDYIIHFVKSTGKTNGKVFKLKNVELPANSAIAVSKKHTIKTITTRKYYEGEHNVELLINGESKARQSFYLHMK